MPSADAGQAAAVSVGTAMKVVTKRTSRVVAAGSTSIWLRASQIVHPPHQGRSRGLNTVMKRLAGTPTAYVADAETDPPVVEAETFSSRRRRPGQFNQAARQAGSRRRKRTQEGSGRSPIWIAAGRVEVQRVAGGGLAGWLERVLGGPPLAVGDASRKYWPGG